MRSTFLEYAICPICGGGFDFKFYKEDMFEIEEAILACANCGYSTAVTEGIVNLLFNMDAATLRETNLHVQDHKQMFEKELVNHSLEELERLWANMEQETSREYGVAVKNIFNHTIDQADLRNDDAILDLGAGTGWSTAQLAKRFGYCVAIDLCKPIKLGLSKVFLSQETFFERCLANIECLPFKDGCFDAVTSMASLHHVTNLDAALGESWRVLKEGGRLVLIGEPVVPQNYLGTDEEYRMQKEKGFNEHQYTAQQWLAACERAGFAAADGSSSSGDDLDRYYQVNEAGIQTPLPVFIKKTVGRGGFREILGKCSALLGRKDR